MKNFWLYGVRLAFFGTLLQWSIGVIIVSSRTSRRFHHPKKIYFTSVPLKRQCNQTSLVFTFQDDDTTNLKVHTSKHLAPNITDKLCQVFQVQVVSVDDNDI